MDYSYERNHETDHVCFVAHDYKLVEVISELRVQFYLRMKLGQQSDILIAFKSEFYIHSFEHVRRADQQRI